MASAWVLSQYLSNRAVYLHMGAMLGTTMVCNVWMRILSHQRKMIAIARAGGKPQYYLAAQSARCSRHNTFMSVPVIFLMISSHYPSITFGTETNLILLGGLVLAGWCAAGLIRKYA